MSLTVFLKNNLNHIPPYIGIHTNKIPFNLRPGIGSSYRERIVDINNINNMNDDQKKNYIFQNIYKLTEFSYNNILFYNEYYKSQNFHPSLLKTYSDIIKIPIISKELLNKYPIELRSYKQKNRYKVNTGGSSGMPFSFYIEPSSMATEWAHMHLIWAKLGYKQSDIKLMFGGRSDVNDLVQYDFVRNSFSVDIYADYDLVAEKLIKILKRYRIKYLHGYPSSIYDFAHYCKEKNTELLHLLSSSLVGAFLGSEYPHKYYRDFIESTFNIKTISWYGHTERSVLAYERKEKYIYEPFITYGFAEAFNYMPSEYQLIATSYYNFASPLIRYNTEDIISEPEIENDILKRFRIKNGRSGEFVIDRKNKKVNLTGLIFGRHHKLFDFTKFIQVKQLEKGKIEIHYVPKDPYLMSVEKLFDIENLDLDISFIKRDEPYRTQAGKINLIIK